MVNTIARGIGRAIPFVDLTNACAFYFSTAAHAAIRAQSGARHSPAPSDTRGAERAGQTSRAKHAGRGVREGVGLTLFEIESMKSMACERHTTIRSSPRHGFARGRARPMTGSGGRSSIPETPSD